MDYSTRWLRVALPPQSARLITGAGWRLDARSDSTAADRAAAALADFAAPPAATGENARCAQLRRALVGSGPPSAVTSAAEERPPWATKGGGPPLRAARAALAAAGLNPSQVAAGHAALTRTLTLWRGPPGTGKTRALAGLIASALPALPAPVLVSAASNVATDNIAAALIALGVNVVRVGQPAKVAAAVRPQTLAARTAASPAGKAAAALRASAAAAPKGAAGRADRERAAQLEAAAAAAVLDSAAVVAATCVGAGDPTLDGRTFSLVAIDEATQATEPAALIPLLRAATAALLVGDPRQLPPTVVSPGGVAAGLGVSLFERLEAAGLEPLTLDTQYRMHPGISEFPADRFYGGRLRDGIPASARPRPPGLAWPSRVPVAFVQCDGPEVGGGGGSGDSTTATTTTYANPAEAAAVAAIVTALLRAGASQDAVGVVTPYAGQARALRRALNAAPASADVEVRTVDGFQGREKEVIVMSTVRSNGRGGVGFLADARRLNVALTRARAGLVVVGDARTLLNSPVWGAWLGWCGEKGAVVGGGVGDVL